MGDKTGIQWTDATWNPVTGCTKVSQGCKHCYAEKVFPRAYSRNTVAISDDVHQSEPRARRFTDVWTHEDRLDQPLRWKRPRRVFVNSMSDLFHEDVPFEFIASVFAIMGVTTRHTYQILTKRPERMFEFFKWAHQVQDDHGEWCAVDADDFDADRRIFSHWPESIPWKGYDNCGPAYPYTNVWLGVSVEDQVTADERIPLLLRTPAAVRFVSYEPALGPVDFAHIPCEEGTFNALTADYWHVDDLGNMYTVDGPTDRLSWVIVGGESGRGARPFDVQWARDTVAQCQAAGVPVFVKQLGRRPCGLRPYCDRCNWQIPKGAHGLDCDKTPVLADRKGGDMNEWPLDLRVREFPAAGADTRA